MSTRTQNAHARVLVHKGRRPRVVLEFEDKKPYEDFVEAAGGERKMMDLVRKVFVHLEELLERREDEHDVELLKKMRKKKMKFYPFEDVLKELSLIV